jgi:hypothetical protein
MLVVVMATSLAVLQINRQGLVLLVAAAAFLRCHVTQQQQQQQQVVALVLAALYAKALQQRCVVAP